ncbi:hypothetical protein [Mongoliimonas terrestris]|uniref:hypothetical protein n=1 Tax=Mongoliimonas terrestris TaxID=1709001 RepID=UPI000A59B1AF|nr:hypothetical protein [Mongoliimonas terrestris]
MGRETSDSEMRPEAAAWQPMAYIPVRAAVDVRDESGIIALAECRKVGARLVFLAGALAGPPVSWRWPRD